jgi:hypothetical protein
VSRIENVPIERDGKPYLLVVGWDPPLRSFYGQVFEQRDRMVVDAARVARKLREVGHGDAADDLEDAAADAGEEAPEGPVLWVGAGDALPTVDSLAAALGPFGEGVSDDRLRLELETHQKIDDAHTVVDWRRMGPPPAPADPVRRAADALAKGCGSLLWVLNNRHNADDPRWEELVEAAEHDARQALAAYREATQ